MAVACHSDRAVEATFDAADSTQAGSMVDSDNCCGSRIETDNNRFRRHCWAFEWVDVGEITRECVTVKVRGAERETLIVSR